MQGKFNGAGRAAFDSFKARTDEIAVELSASLNAVLTGISGQERAFASGDSQIADMSRQQQSSLDFDAARFAAR